MKVAFVGLFYASMQPRARHGELPLCAKRKGDRGSNEAPKHRGQITYRLPPYTYTQDTEDYMYLKDVGKITTAMWRDYVEQSGQMDPKLNRPLRHYPAHHYRREMQQKIGLQRKEARINKAIADATTPKPRDDFTALHPSHHPRILDAFEKLKAWKRQVKLRLNGVSEAEEDGHIDGDSQETQDADCSYADDGYVETGESGEGGKLSPFGDLDEYGVSGTSNEIDDKENIMGYYDSPLYEQDYDGMDMYLDSLPDDEDGYDPYMGLEGLPGAPNYDV